ncbi:hypothetical protein Tco_1193048 [Tanacetum coccineum]
MTWHATGQSKEKGKMNHPCDGRAWKYFDMMKPEFSGDARNVRLGLAADGFNPFGMMSQTYSIPEWAHLLNPPFPYNQPLQPSYAGPSQYTGPPGDDVWSHRIDVETRFNRLGRNDDGLPEEEPNKFQVFRSACKLTGRMKATRLTTDVRQAVVWFVLNNSPEVDADILAYREKCLIMFWKTKFPDGLITSTCTYPACHSERVKFVVNERDILHNTQCRGSFNTRADGEMVLWINSKKSWSSLISANVAVAYFQITRWGMPVKVQKGHYEDLIETWRKTHSRPETGEFKTQKNLKRYVMDMRELQDRLETALSYKTDQDILDESRS